MALADTFREVEQVTKVLKRKFLGFSGKLETYNVGLVRWILNKCETFGQPLVLVAAAVITGLNTDSKGTQLAVIDVWGSSRTLVLAVKVLP